MLRFTTAGESHGAALVSILEGCPPVCRCWPRTSTASWRAASKATAAGGACRSSRTRSSSCAGVRAGETLGSPIAMLIRNRDWANWQEIMDPAPRGTDAGPDGKAPAGAVRSRDRVPGTPISPACSSTTGTTRATSWSGRPRARPRRAWRRARSAGGCCASSASRSAAISCSWVASTRRDPSRARRYQRGRGCVAAPHARSGGRDAHDRAHRRRSSARATRSAASARSSATASRSDSDRTSPGIGSSTGASAPRSCRSPR